MAARSRPPKTRLYVCQHCGTEWSAPSKIGQPPRYCTDVCRKAAAVKRAAQWQKDNPERTAEHRSNHWTGYYAKNRERLIRSSIEYQRANPERKKAYDAARYALTRGATEAERFTLDDIYQRDGGVCHLCDLPVVRDKASVDHIVPVSLGGPHTRANVALAHFACNASRKTRSVEEFRERHNSSRGTTT